MCCACFIAFRRIAPIDTHDAQVLGDIVISVETARRQAEERHKNLRDELRVLLVHGVLHLVGYDHERSPAELERVRIQ